MPGLNGLQTRPGNKFYPMPKILENIKQVNNSYDKSVDNTNCCENDNTYDLRTLLQSQKYRFKSQGKNPEWSVEKLISLRSCHIHNNATPENQELLISNIPKWLTVLEKPVAVD